MAGGGEARATHQSHAGMAVAPPTLEPAYSEGPKIRVKFPTAPSGARFIRICFESASCTHHVDAVTCKLVDEPAQAFPVADGSCTVEVFSFRRYVAKAQFATSEGWGPWSSASNAISLHLLVPAAPAAPVLEAGSKSLRVLWTLPPQPKNTSAYTHVTVWIKCGNGQWKPVDSTTGTLDVQGATTSFKASLLQCTVTGLEEGKEYKAKLSVLNGAGWGDSSPDSELLQLPTSEVQLVGSTSREEKDEAGRKRAIDVDDPAKGGDGGGTSHQRQKTAARVKRE